MSGGELRDELAEAIRPYVGITPRALEIVADEVLPVVRRFADAQVAAERERIAAGLQRLAKHVMDAEIDEGLELLDILAAGQLPGLERGQP